MKIHPHDNVLARVEDVIEGLNRDPKAGDEGHVDDHARLAQVMFDVPQSAVILGMAYREDGQWHLSSGTDFNVAPVQVPFADVRQATERPGVVAVAGAAHTTADGVTDWTEDGSDLEGVSVYIFAAGVLGLSYAVADMIQRLAVLEAAQA